MNLTDLIRSHFTAIRQLDQAGNTRSAVDILADRRLASLASTAMADKLTVARAKGRGGWWDPAVCSIDQLREMLRAHVDKGDMVDVMNLAAMIYVREVMDEAPEEK